jgi:hypothetical protein
MELENATTPRREKFALSSYGEVGKKTLAKVSTNTPFGVLAMVSLGLRAVSSSVALIRTV